MSKLVIAYAAADGRPVKRLAGDLRAKGHGVWGQEIEASPTEQTLRALRLNFALADYVLLAVSSSSLESNWLEALHRSDSLTILWIVLDQSVPANAGAAARTFDFSGAASFQEGVAAVAQVLGDVELPAVSPLKMIAMLEELSHVRAATGRVIATSEAPLQLDWADRSEFLCAEIEKANDRFPLHKPVNDTHAIQVGGVCVTLDYLLWTMEKSRKNGESPLEAVLTLKGRWGPVQAMLDAYSDLLGGLAAHK